MKNKKNKVNVSQSFEEFNAELRREGEEAERTRNS